MILTIVAAVFIASNDFSGDLPDELLSLSVLEELYAEDNSFTGPVPELPSSLTQCDLSKRLISFVHMLLPSLLSSHEVLVVVFVAGNFFCVDPYNMMAICAIDGETFG